ncbi:nucleoside hydrolase [Croceitalea rosinachiae]|uniref:Nucleoside hydrolase n=1 Tax=Croceitalea rosinachiae TaxID=3075596 RepID=A0ABU3A8N0_9FLAO|nr:nucleoside hydrolase [Croceitalea sp. F388]MDT0606547.1 nucleoside hydrolase [Croceitalea sp. F388]
MKKKSLLFIFLMIFSTTGFSQVQIIFDTDFGGDADDLGALAMLNHFQNKGEIDLLSVMCWNVEKHAVSAIDAVNTFYGNPYIPIGLRDGEEHETAWNHSKTLVDNLPYDATKLNVPEATRLYRKLLSESENNSVIIVAVGPLMNIKRLIESKADQYSDLDGSKLIHSKVKEFVIMGGNFPVSKDEWNFNGDMPGVTKFVLEHIGLPITFSGAELGSAIKTGEVFNELPKDSPLYLGFYHFGKYAPWMKHQFKGKIFDNATFDQTAVLYAIRNGVGKYWHKVTDGICVSDGKGGNTWEPRINSNHSYLVLDMPIPEIEKELEAFMLGKF